MSIFNLKNEEYSLEELKEIFNLSSNLGLASEYEIIQSGDNLKNKLSNGKDLDKEQIEKIKNFIDISKDRLINDYKTQNSYTNSRQLGLNIHDNTGNSSSKDKTTTTTTTTTTTKPKTKANKITTLLSIDSLFIKKSVGESSSNFSFNLPTVLENVEEIILLDLMIPGSVYDISPNLGNNTFLINLKINDAIQTLKVIIPMGYYTPYSLVNWLNTVTFIDDWNQQIPDSEVDGVPYLVANINSTSGRMVIGVNKQNESYDSIESLELDFVSLVQVDSNEQTNTQQSSLSNIPLQARLGWLMGFRVGYYKGSKNYISEGIPIIYPGDYIKLDFNDYNFISGRTKYLSLYADSFQDTNTLAIIPVTVDNINEIGHPISWSNKGSNIVNSNGKRIFSNPVRIEKIQVSLRDRFNRILDLNNNNWSFRIQINHGTPN